MAWGCWAIRSPELCLPSGSSQVENIQPFSAKDLSIRSLGDRIRDLGQLRNLYPNTPKDQAFGSHYNSECVGAEMGPGVHICLPSNAVGRSRGGWERRGVWGLTQVLPAPELAGAAGAGKQGWHGVAPCWGGSSWMLLLSEQKSRRARMAGATSPPPSR